MALAEVRALDQRERVLLASAAGLVLLARTLLPVAGLDRTRRAVARTAGLLPRGPADADSLAWAVTTASNALPVTTACLAEGLAGRALFERHGLDADLRLGVESGESFRAHAWVEHEGEVVVGSHTDLDAFEPLER